MNKDLREVRLVPVGKVVRTHGVRGALKIYSYGDSFRGLGVRDTLEWRSVVGRPPRTLTLLHVKPHGRAWVVQFEELATLEEAQQVVGGELCLPENRLSPLDEGEFYHYQLIGLSVETLQGKTLGVIRGILETGANDVYVIEAQGKEILIPAVEDCICEVDLEGGRMVVDPPEGLIDDL